MKLEQVEGGGRARPVPIKGSEFILETDLVIKAIGQSRFIPLLEQLEIEHTRGVVKINTVTHQTSNPRIFAAGDVIFGEGQGEAMVVSAVQQGKLAAFAIYNLVKNSDDAAAPVFQQ
jgi:glutamate synthase (NADPH/NADH) small chain